MYFKKSLIFLSLFLLISGLAFANTRGNYRGGVVGEDVELDTWEFDNNLSSLDTDVQKAMETLDELAASGVNSYTISGLPAAPDDGTLAVVTDGADESDCTVGGGTNLNACIYDADGTAWVIAGDGTTASGADAVSIDGSAVTDPDFVSTGDIDFVDTSNTVTANINTGAVQDAEIDYTNVTLNDFTFDVGSVDKTEYGYLNGVTSAIQTQLDAKLENVVEDTTPQLGGELDAQGNSISDLADITFRTGASGGTLRTGTSNADKFILQAYDVDDATYRDVIELDAGNDVRLQLFADFFEIEDATDATKQVTWDLSGATTGTATDLIFSQTANRTITFPDATDTLVGKDTTDTLTNKTLNAADNVIDADTGDSATSFFDAGTIEHERGGLEFDASAVADGDFVVGTGAGSMGLESGATARSTMGVAIGSDVQAYDADLDDLADGTLTGTKVDQAATGTRGTVELATTAETDSGTDTSRAVTPDALAGSVLGTKTLIFKWQATDGTTGTGDGAMCATIPAELDGMNLVTVGAHVYTASSSGTPTYQIRNQTDTADMLSTKLTIDASEKDSSTAATAAVIDTANDDVVEGDEICIDKDVAGTGEAGDEIRAGFRLP